MTVRPTSVAAYDSVDIGSRQREVLNAIRELGAATDKEIARHLSWEINRVTPRRGELVAAGLVTERGRRRTERAQGHHLARRSIPIKTGHLRRAIGPTIAGGAMRSRAHERGARNRELLKKLRGASPGREKYRKGMTDAYTAFRKLKASEAAFKKTKPLTDKQREAAISQFISEHGITKCPMRVVWA